LESDRKKPEFRDYDTGAGLSFGEVLKAASKRYGQKSELY
jgi:hypothetical protein